MAYSAILFSYFFSKSSTASSRSLDFGILVFCANKSSSFASSFFKEDVNLVRFTNTVSGIPRTALHYLMLYSVSMKQ